MWGQKYQLAMDSFCITIRQIHGKAFKPVSNDYRLMYNRHVIWEQFVQKIALAKNSFFFNK